jgi:hypothetical protein
MAATVTFVKDTETCPLPAPEPGGTARLERTQARASSAGGTLYVYDTGRQRRLHMLLLRGLTAAEGAALEAFFDHVGGMGETFTYTDSAGAAHTVRFADPELALEEAGPDCLDITLRLEEDATVTP